MRRRDESGMILVVVLIFALLLTSTVATFLRKSTLDTLIVRNRDARARADALSRGGIRLAAALVIADRVDAAEGGAGVNSSQALWAQLSGRKIPTDDDASLRVHVADAGAKLNFNAIVANDEDGNLASQAIPLLEALLEKVIDEIPKPPAEKFYDVSDLAANLVDFVDPDDLRQRGGDEDDYYQAQSPPYRAVNRPLLSLDELRRVEGFDASLVDALEPYLTVHPYAATRGINPNTAPPHVLALLFFDDGIDLRLAPEDTVREILRVRQDGGILCGDDQSDEDCTPIGDIVRNAIYPPPDFSGSVFTFLAEARVGDVARSIEAVYLFRTGGEMVLLSWRVL